MAGNDIINNGLITKTGNMTNWGPKDDFILYIHDRQTDAGRTAHPSMTTQY